MDEPVVMSLFDKWANATSVAGFFISLVSLGIRVLGFLSRQGSHQRGCAED